MAVKIAGIISITVAFIGLLVFTLIWFDRKAKQQETERKQRLLEKSQTDEFVIALFEQLNTDTDELNNRLFDKVAERDEQISALQREIQNMKDIAAKCGLKDIYDKQEEAQ